MSYCSSNFILVNAMGEMKKILIVAFPFPPFGIGETVRVMKFIKYLPENGWEPVVLTLRSKREADFSAYKDLTVYRVPSSRQSPNIVAQQSASSQVSPVLLSLRRWLMIPDGLMWWVPFAVNAGVRIAKEECVDAIYSVSPNHSCHLIAMQIKKKLKIPWVADFKDPWTTNPFEVYPTSLHKRLNLFFERRVINQTDRVITISEPIKEDFINRHPDAKDKISVITNGFDSDDFKNLKEKNKDMKRITIVHTGSLYGPRDPTTFLQAVSQIKKSEPELAKKLRIIFVGKSESDIAVMAKDLDINELVEIVPPVPYEESLQYQVDSDILLLITGPGKGTVTGKVFEYMAIGKPIIAVTEEDSFVANILRRTNLGFISDANNVEKINDMLKNICKMVIEKKLPELNRDEINKYDRKNLTIELVKIFNELS